MMFSLSTVRHFVHTATNTSAPIRQLSGDASGTPVAPYAVYRTLADGPAGLVGGTPGSTYTDRRPLRWRTVHLVVTVASLPVPDHGRMIP